MIETDGLYRFLLNDFAVSSFVGARIYKRLLPVGYILPAIVIVKVTSVPLESLGGDNATEIRRFQFDCFAKVPDTSSQLARAVRSLLVPKSDGSGTTTNTSYDLPDGTHVQSARLHMDQDMAPEEGTGPSGTIHRCLIDVEFTYTNP